MWNIRLCSEQYIKTTGFLNDRILTLYSSQNAANYNALNEIETQIVLFTNLI